MARNTENPVAKVRQARSLKDVARIINAAERRAVTDVLAHARQQGECLEHAKDRCLREQKPWLEWLKDNVEFSRQSADRYLKIYREWGKLPNVGNMGLCEALNVLAVAERPVPNGLPAGTRVIHNNTRIIPAGPPVVVNRAVPVPQAPRMINVRAVPAPEPPVLDAGPAAAAPADPLAAIGEAVSGLAPACRRP
jgi:hypothetical protein